MKLKVLCENYEEYKIPEVIDIQSVLPCSPVYAVKWIIYQKFQIFVGCQILTLEVNQKRIVLCDNTNLGDYNITPQSKLVLRVLERQKTRKKMIYGFDLSEGKKISEMSEFLGPIIEIPVVPFQEFSSVLDLGFYGPLSNILSFINPMDLLINVIHVNRDFRKFVHILWKEGKLPHVDELIKDPLCGRCFLHILFILGFCDEDLFLFICKRYPDLINEKLHMNPRKFAMFLGGHYSLMISFDDNFNYEIIRVCVERGFLKGLEYFLQFRNQKYVASINGDGGLGLNVGFKTRQEDELTAGRYPKDGRRGSTYLNNCAKNRRPYRMIRLLIDTFPGILLPRNVFTCVFEKEGIEGVIQVLKGHRPNLYGNQISVRKILLLYFEAVKSKKVKGDLSEYLELEKYLPSFRLPFVAVEGDPNNVRYLSREYHGRMGQEEQEFSYVYSNKSIFSIINYNLHLLDMELVKYFLTKDFGVWKRNHKKRFKISREMRKWKELMDFIVLEIGNDNGCHNLYSKEVIQLKIEYKKV